MLATIVENIMKNENLDIKQSRTSSLNKIVSEHLSILGFNVNNSTEHQDQVKVLLENLSIYK